MKHSPTEVQMGNVVVSFEGSGKIYEGREKHRDASYYSLLRYKLGGFFWKKGTLPILFVPLWLAAKKWQRINVSI